ncbi:MAG: 2,5-diamino-6-(ribosylamino)-4(3H)-pyrimidinone 5'-phosphate reductase [Nitrososphaeraceae archaeon]
MKIVINAAMTADGKIATKNGSSAISSNVDLIRVHQLRNSADVIMVGISTVLADDPQLTVRFGTAGSKAPTRVVVDSTGRIPSTSKILKKASELNTIVATSNRISFENIRRIQSTGAKVLVAGRDKVELKKVFRLLEKMGHKKILVEGGGELNWSVLKLGIVDELIITISPRIVGGRSAITLVEGEGCDRISEGIPLKLRDVRRNANGEMILFYEL